MKLFKFIDWLLPAQLYQANVAAATIGAAVVTGAVSSNAASKASKSQQAGADQADATQRYMYDTTRDDNAPFRETGVDANNRLAFMLGLSKTKAGPFLTNEQIRAEELPNFQTYRNGMVYQTDEAGLNAAIGRRIDERQAAEAASVNDTDDPEYGSLLRNFTMADRDADPVYQSGLEFGLSEGTKGLNRMAAANGSLNSGKTLKALTRFGNDYGSTKANESFNRFNTNQDRTYNKLAGLSGAGQQATNQVSAAGTNMANNISQNQIGMGNARAASAIGQSNALTGALGQGYNMYQQQQMMNRLFPTGGNSMAGYNGGYSNLAYDVGNMS